MLGSCVVRERGGLDRFALWEGMRCLQIGGACFYVYPHVVQTASILTMWECFTASSNDSSFGAGDHFLFPTTFALAAQFAFYDRSASSSERRDVHVRTVSGDGVRSRAIGDPHSVRGIRLLPNWTSHVGDVNCCKVAATMACKSCLRFERGWSSVCCRPVLVFGC